MPVVMKCPKCGFDGNHGFTDTVAGIMVYYHFAAGDMNRDRSADHQTFRTPDGRWFTDRKEAWEHYRPILRRNGASENWLRAWDYRMCEKPRIQMYNKYIKLWQEEQERFMAGQTRR